MLDFHSRLTTGGEELASRPLIFSFPFFSFNTFRIVITYQTMQYVLCTSLEKSPQTNPIIGRIDCKAGHGAGRPTQKMVTNSYHYQVIFPFSILLYYVSCPKMNIYTCPQIDEATDRYAFMAKMLDAHWIE